jgi:hypothetical protein
MGRVKQPSEFNLLEIYVKEMERLGETRKNVYLDVDDSIATQIGKAICAKVTLEQVQCLADRCLANECLEHNFVGSGKYGQLSLTATGFGIVRSIQRKEEALVNRTFLKKASDYIEDHKGLFVALTVAIALAGLLLKLFIR